MKSLEGPEKKEYEVKYVEELQASLAEARKYIKELNIIHIPITEFTDANKLLSLSAAKDAKIAELAAVIKGLKRSLDLRDSMGMRGD